MTVHGDNIIDFNPEILYTHSDILYLSNFDIKPESNNQTVKSTYKSKKSKKHKASPAATVQLIKNETKELNIKQHILSSTIQTDNYILVRSRNPISKREYLTKFSDEDIVLKKYVINLYPNQLNYYIFIAKSATKNLIADENLTFNSKTKISKDRAPPYIIANI
jgi:hypothetical protein